MKKIFLLTVSLAACAMCLTSCGDDDPPPGPGETALFAAGTYTLNGSLVKETPPPGVITRAVSITYVDAKLELTATTGNKVDLRIYDVKDNNPEASEDVILTMSIPGVEISGTAGNASIDYTGTLRATFGTHVNQEFSGTVKASVKSSSATEGSAARIVGIELSFKDGIATYSFYADNEPK